MARANKLKRVQHAKTGGEAVETSLVSIGLLLVGAVLVVIFVLLLGRFHDTFAAKTQGSQESFNLLVAKLEEMDKPGGITEAAHAYYIQEGYHLLGFNSDPDEVKHIRSDSGIVKTSKMCGSDQACICICDDSTCGGKVVDCNKKAKGESVTFNNIKYFVVTDDQSNSLNQGKPVSEPAGVIGNYLAIFGQWGGLCAGCGVGFGCHCWQPGKVIKLTKDGQVVKITLSGT